MPSETMPSPNPKEGPLVRIQEICEGDLPPADLKQLTTRMCVLSGVANSISINGTSTSSSTPTTATSTESRQWENDAESLGTPATTCCHALAEFYQAKNNHPVLASTGCTRDFCQAGRAAHTDEPRVGENRALEVIEREAEGFLRELHQEDFFENDKAFEGRLDTVLAEIRLGVRDGIVRDSRKDGAIGGVWHQTSAELEFGIRRAWRNARKCIMRSHSDELK
ncbi:MAG: hypothetical protein Q9198_003657 [Flavoplaca austrocitrina]